MQSVMLLFLISQISGWIYSTFWYLKIPMKVPADLQGGQNNLPSLATVTSGPVFAVDTW